MDFFDINKLSKFIGLGFSGNRLFVYDDDIIITSLIDYKFFIELRRTCKFLQGADIGPKKNSIIGSRIPYKRERPFRFHFHKLKQETQTLLNFCNKVIHSSSIGSLYDEIRHPGADDLFLISAVDAIQSVADLLNDRFQEMCPFCVMGGQKGAPALKPSHSFSKRVSGITNE